MASLSIRRIDERTYSRLRAKATQNGVSMEEQVRRILRQAVSAPERLGSLAVEIFGEDNGIDLERPLREVAKPIDLAGSD